MPHRTIFQWGKNTAHPFTVFMGGVVIGALVTGAIAYSWVLSDAANVEFDEVTVPVQSTSTPASLTPDESPSATPAASTNDNGQPQF